MSTINQNIAVAASRVPFDASEYVWIDLSDVPPPPTDIKDFSQELHAMHVTEMPMLFEKMAIIPPRVKWAVDEVGTLERKGDVLLYCSYAQGMPDALFAAEAFNHPTLLNEWTCNLTVAQVISEGWRRQHGMNTEQLSEWLGDATATFIAYVYYATVLKNNVTTTHSCLANPANAKRVRKGKLPMYEWRTIEITSERREQLAQALRHAKRQPVRQHDVRGHWATRKKSGKRYWVRSHKRGDASVGTIFHDYQAKK